MDPGEDRKSRSARRPAALRVFATLAIAALAACASAPTQTPAPAPAPEFTTTFSLGYGGRMIIPVFVNGEGPFDFILDSASSRSAVFANLARRLPESSERQTNVRVFGLANVVEAPVVAVGAVQIGSRRFSNVNMAVFDDWDGQANTPQGIVGMDLIQQFLLVADIAAGVVAFHEPADAPALTAGWKKAQTTATDFGIAATRLMLTEGSLTGEKFPMLIDTGSALTLGNLDLIDVVATIPRIAPRRAKGEIADVGDARVPSYYLRFSSLKAGGVTWRDGEIYVSNASIFEALGYADKPFVILGLDLLLRSDFALSPATGALFVRRNERRPDAPGGSLNR